jgi:hypothetical protein
VLEIDVRELRPLCYKIEKDRSQTSYRDLTSQEQWEKIVAWGLNYRTKQLNKTNGTPNEWSVKVKDVSDGKSSGSKVGSFR